MPIKSVFLSSTARDLADFREKVYEAINGLDGYKCVRMEDFGARDAEAEAFCAARVGESDLLVGIVGHVYGSCPEDSDRSYTEIEYDAATKKDIPRLMFVAPDNFPVPAHLIEGTEKRKQQQAFRERVDRERIRFPFSSPDDLGARVVQAIHNWEATRQGKGIHAVVTGSRKGERVRIAVLSFQNLSRQDEDEAFSDGLTEFLISSLTSIEDLQVIERTSVLSLKEQPLTLPDMGRLLEVDYMVEGSLYKQEESCRVTAKLIKVSDQSYVWSDVVEFPWTQVFDVQQQVAEHVVEKVKSTLRPTERRSLGKAPTENAEALAAFMKGRHSLRQFNNLRKKAYFRETEKFFKRAVRLDPKYAESMAELGFLYLITWETAGDKKWLQKCKRAFEDTLDIDPENGLALSELGYLTWLEGDSDRAVELARKSVELYPDRGIPNNVLALIYLYMGFYEANETIETSAVIPADPLYIYPYTNLALALQCMARYDDALARARQARAIEPHALVAILLEGAQHYCVGDLDAAETVWREGLEVCSADVKAILEVALAWIPASQGDQAAARRVVCEHRTDPWLPGAYGPYYVSLCSLAGERDTAMEVMRQQTTYARSYRYLISDSTLRPLQTDPRFQVFLRERYEQWMRDVEQWALTLPVGPPALPDPDDLIDAWD